MKKDILITIPLESFIEQMFGEERRYYVPLQPTIAEVIEYHIKNSHLELQYRIQYTAYQEISRFVSYSETRLAHPRLWIYSDWYDSEQNWQRRKIQSENDRIEAEILAKNIKLVAKYYKEFTSVNDNEVAEAKAYGLIKGNKFASIKMLGVPMDKFIIKPV